MTLTSLARLTGKLLRLLAFGICLAHSAVVTSHGQGTVVAWGNNDSGQTTVPAGLSNVVAVAAGGAHTVALKSDGTVVAWGANDEGQTAVPAGLSGVVAIAAGGAHTVALKQDGTVTAWGNNDSGQTTVPADLSNVVAIAAGGVYTVALKRDGRVVAWGGNISNVLRLPESGLSDVVAIAAGGAHTVALKRVVGPWAWFGVQTVSQVANWGDDAEGKLAVPSGLSNVVAIAAGGAHTVALKRDGKVIAWGRNGEGQTTVPLNVSRPDENLASPVVAVAAGGAHTVALRSDGTAAAWGANDKGQSAVPPTLSQVWSLPDGLNLRQVNTNANVVAIAAGGAHTVALIGDGRGPALPSILFQPLSQVAIGGSNATFSVTATGMAPLSYQWRFNGTPIAGATNASYALVNVQTTQTGGYRVVITNAYGAITSSIASLTVEQLNQSITFAALPTKLTTDAPFTLASTASSSLPVSYTSSDSSVATISGNTVTIRGAGSTSITALQAGNATYAAAPTVSQTLTVIHGQPAIATQPMGQTACVGSNTTFNVTPTDPTPLSYQWRFNGTPISGATNANYTLTNVQTNQAGGYSVVITNVAGAITSSVASLTVVPAGTVVAWGANDKGQTAVPAGLSGVVAIAAGGAHTVALKSDGTVVAWGSNDDGQTTVPAGLDGVSAIAAGDYHTVALKSDGTVVAWGGTNYGQTTVPAGLSGVMNIAAGTFHTVAVKSNGTVVAWGSNTETYYLNGPATVPAGLADVRAIAAGGGRKTYYVTYNRSHSVALKSDGTVVAWDGTAQFLWNLPKGLFGVAAITAGNNHLVALKSDGTAVAWGAPDPFGYGPPDFGQTTVPAGLNGGVTAVAAGGHHTVALVGLGPPLGSIPPFISVSPQSQTLIVGSAVSNAAISVTASGSTPLRYQWRFNGDNIAGATNAVLTLSNVQTNQAGSYSVVVTNVAGATTSSVASLTVYALPKVTTHPQNQTVSVGSAATFGVTATGTAPLHYQWRFNGNNLNGATNAVLTLGNVQTDQVGSSYSVVVTNVAGAITSSVAVLDVQIPPQIVQQPSAWIGVQGVEAKLSVGATGSPLAYEWLKNGSSIGGAVGSELLFDAFSATNGARYSVRVYNAVGSVTSPEVRAILPTQTNTIPSLVVRPANAPVVTFDGIDPVAGRILRGGITRVAMSTTFPGGGVFYTLDGSEPIVGGNAREYVGPFYVYESCVIRAVAVDQLFVSQVAAPTVAVEVRPLYPVEAFSKGGGAVALGTPAYSGKLYVSNTLVSATATASNGWSLLNWNGAAAAGTNIAVRATAATRLEAVFGTVLSTVGGGTGSGTIEASPILSLYPYGTEVKLLARPQAGSYLFRWQPLATVQNPISVTVTNAGITNSAVFSPLLNGYVSLVADVVGRGQMAQNPLQGQYLTGSAVTLTAVPAAQHRFVRWQGDIAATSNPLNLTLTANTSVQAVFEPDIRIVHEPAARDVVVGATAIFSVGATGPGTLTYQWRKNGQPLAGENGVLLVVRTTAASGISVYDVVVTSGATSITSAGAALRAYAPSAVFAWGVNNFGQLNVPAGLTNAVTVAAGNTHSLAVNQQGAVLAWGDSSEGKLVVPQALSNVTCIAAGNDFSLAGDRLGRVYAWGRNNYGQLNLPLALLNAVQISAGDSFCVGLSATGEVVAWGRNDFGQTNVPFGLTNVTAVAAGGRHAAAMLSDGRVVAWGANNAGQASIPAGLSNVVAIAAGGDFSLALRRDGTVVGWGSNAEGQTTIPAAATNVQAVACGVDHSLALRADGSLLAWGRNDQGQLNFPPGLTNAVAISANSQFSVGIRRGLLNTNESPTLTTQPLGQTVGVGSNVTYSVTATGTAPLAYQWRFNGTPIAGATNASYALFNVQTNQAGSYSVVVTNLAGSVTSSNALLTVNRLAQTITFAAIPNKLTTDAPFALSATASSGLPVSYTSSAASVATISGSTVTIVGAGTATITAMQAGNATYAAAPTVTQTLTVYAPPALTTQPLGQTVGVGSNVTFTVTATGTAPLAYQWRHNGTPISGATTETLALTNVNRANAGSYAVVVTNAGGGVTSSPALLRVLVPQRLLTPERLGDGRFRLRFGDFDGGLAGAGELGAFEVYATTNVFNTNSWARLTNGLSIVNGQVEIEDAGAPGLARRFYRIIER